MNAGNTIFDSLPTQNFNSRQGHCFRFRVRSCRCVRNAEAVEEKPRNGQRAWTLENCRGISDCLNHRHLSSPKQTSMTLCTNRSADVLGLVSNQPSQVGNVWVWNQNSGCSSINDQGWRKCVNHTCCYTYPSLGRTHGDKSPQTAARDTTSMYQTLNPKPQVNWLVAAPYLH